MKGLINKYLLSSIVMLVLFLSCSSTQEILNKTITNNSKDAQDKPYVLLISLDGFRHDYVDTYKPPHLISFIEGGIQATSLIPSFPTKTFPNHYTIATGMYPDNHGLLANSYFNYKKNAMYSIGDRKKVVDGTYYRGTPIWVNANNEGMVTASYFFVGTEADVQGIHPTYYYNYDGSVSNQERVDQVIKWLELPEEKRPHLITLYFSDMDDVGHKYGPNNAKKIKEALYNLDNTLGNLFERLNDTDLSINTLIVSDHGIKEMTADRLLPIDPIINDKRYRVIDNGVLLSIHPYRTKDIEKIYNLLKREENHYTVYKTENTPHFEYIPKDPNWGPIQLVPDDDYYFTSQKNIDRRKQSTQNTFGAHGFSPSSKDMHGIFYGNGPLLKDGYTHPSIKNIHIYPLLCKMLGLKIPEEIDGRLKAVENVLTGN